MFGPLRSDAADGFADLPPARSLTTGILRRCVAKAIRGPPEHVCESKCGQCSPGLLGHTGDGFLAAVFHQRGCNGFWVSHASTLPVCAQAINHVLTTMC